MKDKMRCARCGKMFKPTKSSQTLCEQCEKLERAARAAARSSGASNVKVSTPSAQPVKIVGPAATLLDPNATQVSATSAPPPDTGLYGSAAIREEQRREQLRRDEQRRAEERARDEQRAREFAQRHEEQRPRRDTPDQHAHGPARDAKRAPASRPAAPRADRPAAAAPRPRKESHAAPRIELTDDLRAKIEARYLELARPIEFDGIRTRIAGEMSVPKSLVKRAVAELRTRMQLPSWWELQAYSGAETDLERIRKAYLPHLPLPEVGIHKLLADELSLDPRTVYQGIRRIRAEMRLPQYNAPELHGDAAPTQGAAGAAPEPNA